MRKLTIHSKASSQAFFCTREALHSPFAASPKEVSSQFLLLQVHSVKNLAIMLRHFAYSHGHIVFSCFQWSMGAVQLL